MGQQQSLRGMRRELRKVLGPEVAELVIAHQIRIAALSQILRRGLFGRLKWLLLGR
jgi:hypothetical protein